MRFFTSIATFGLAAIAIAQETSSGSGVASPTSGSATSSPSLTAEQRCLADCNETDICCQAACVKMPCPNELAANQTTACAGACTQGNGTEEETAAYASCQASCISASFFPISTGAGSSSTGSGASASATGESATGIGNSEGSATGSGSSASETGSSASASATGSSSDASNVKTAISGAGLLGLIIAGLAL